MVNEMHPGAEVRLSPASEMIRLIVGAYASQAICVISRLGLPDELANGPQPVATLAQRVGAHEGALYRVLRAVSDTGVIEELENRRFALTPVGEILRSDVPGSLRAWAALIGMPFWLRPWSELYEAVMTGRSAFALVNGAPFFDYVAHNPSDAEAFAAGMASMYTSRTILGNYDFSEYATIVDVGGEGGAVLAEILTANPGLQGILFDTPVAVSGAELELSRAGVADRCQVIGGDVFSSVPEGGDVYLLSGMIHGAGDDQALKILSTCRAAMGKTAHLLIAETILPNDGQPSVGKLLDLQMLVLTEDGCFRTEEEIRSLLDRAGFRVLRIQASSDVVTLMEAVPC